MKNETDERIKKALLKVTKEAVEIKDSIWTNIDNVVDYRVNVEPQRYRKPKLRGTWVSILAKGIAAAVLLIFVAVGTPPGVSAINKVKSILAPKKNVVQSLEGQGYKKEVTLVESKSGYTIYIDEDYFKVEHLAGIDKITPKNKSTDSKLPEVYMEIQQVSGTKPQEIYSKLENELKSSNMVVRNTGKVNTPMNALRISASVGTKWNDKMVVYYIASNNKGGSFIIKEQLFNEAEEGLGGRFDNSLKEFRVED
ncbi:MAG: hypothetical protein ACREV6_07460 [Clostridium sp.]|uniref:hypothetical protein n=1 Tax=Clostridium sp. TaxID=1506 RepID=UPI003D6CAC13